MSRSEPSRDAKHPIPAAAALAAPVVTSISPSSGSTGGGSAVTVNGNGFTGATQVRFGATSASSFTVNSDTQITAVSPPGSGTVGVTVTTPGGISSQFVPYTYVAVPAPVLNSLSPSSGPAAGGTVVTLTGSGFTGATAVKFGTALSPTFTLVSPTQINATAPPGSGTVAVTVTTPGGVSPQFVPYTYVAVPAPVLNSLSPSSGPAAGGTVVTLTGTGFTGATSVKFGTTAASSFTVISATQITATAPAGTGTVQVTVTTPSGTSNGLPYTYVTVPAPVLNSLSPTSGPTTGGTTVTLTGTDLTGATSVKFGTTTASSFTVISATQITATAPAGTGTVQVTVTTPSGTSNGLPYAYVSAPSVTGVTPAQGPATGGTTVTLAGSGFTGATQVSFGALPATSFTVVSDTQISAVTPAACPGAAAVTVTTPAGTSPPTVFYFYRGTPAVTQISPDKGPVSGGTTVTLTGSNLLGATTVRFGTLPAPSFTVVSDTQITATVPAAPAGAVAVTVVTPGGTSAPTVIYIYAAVPTLASIAPSSGPATGGNTVTLSGTGLTLAQSVTFGGTPAAFTVVSDAYITAIAPAGTPGSVTVTVTTPGGSAARTYTRVAPPSL
ncbi:IPT/TIG domain-containing protein [Streptomyces sp. NPDC048639]|uniref:IPT/TIG domain-containing protein n=1 Tax=Streptomyces sp. NPDC048639 TaxID=3365581 RepID=UPI0037186515